MKTAPVGSNTLLLQSDLHKFDAIHKKKDGKAYPLTSARVPTYPEQEVSWQMLKIHGKSRCQVFKVYRKQTTINVMFYKTEVSDAFCTVHNNELLLWS